MTMRIMDWWWKWKECKSSYCMG